MKKIPLMAKGEIVAWSAMLTPEDQRDLERMRDEVERSLRDLAYARSQIVARNGRKRLRRALWVFVPLLVYIIGACAYCLMA